MTKRMANDARSMTTAIAAYEIGRTAWAFDRSAKYVELGKAHAMNVLKALREGAQDAVREVPA